MDVDPFELLHNGRLAACRDPQLLEHMLPQLPVTVRLVRVEARQQERAVLPEDAWVVLITLNKDRTQQIKWADIAREGIVLLLDIIIQPLEDSVVIFLVALLREFARLDVVSSSSDRLGSGDIDLQPDGKRIEFGRKNGKV